MGRETTAKRGRKIMANPTTPFRKEETRPAGTNPVTEMAREAASSLTEKAKDMGSAAAHSVGEAASSATQRAKEMGTSVSHAAGDAASDLGHRAEEATSAVGGGMRSLAGTLRENLPREGVMGTASSAVADTLDRGGRYLQQEGLQGIGEDLTNLIRRNPIPSVLIGIAVGYLIARSVRS
jgi:hypothetical protein